MSPSKGEQVLLLRSRITYRDLSEMMRERGVDVDVSTIFRWVQCYAPELEKRVRRYQGYRSGSWRVDETYVRVGGQWKYLFRAVDKHGELIDFMLLDRRDTAAAYRFLGKALKTMRRGHRTRSLLTSSARIRKPFTDCGARASSVRTRSIAPPKYLNNIIEADHGGIKRVLHPTHGFQTMKTAYATIKGFEVMRMIRRRKCILCQPRVTGEIQFVNTLFGLAA